MSFQYVFYPKLFSRNFLKILRIAFSNNAAGGTPLILSDYFLKISRTPFNPLMPGGSKRSYILKQTLNQDFQVSLSMHVLLLPPALKI